MQADPRARGRRRSTSACAAPRSRRAAGGAHPRRAERRPAWRTRSRAATCSPRSAAAPTPTTSASNAPASPPMHAASSPSTTSCAPTSPASGRWATCNGRGAFTHTSYNDHEIVAANLLDGDTRRVSDRIPAYALFIDPPLGRIGMSEAEVRASGRPALVGVLPMTRVGRARERGETQGFMKVLVDAQTERLLGAALLCIEGDEIVHSLLDAMYGDVSCAVMRRAVHIHPTVSELIPTLLAQPQTRWRNHPHERHPRPRRRRRGRPCARALDPGFRARRARRPVDASTKSIPCTWLYDHRGSDAVRADHAAARVLPDPHRDLDPAALRRADRRRGRAGRGGGRTRQRLQPQDAAAAGRAGARPRPTCRSTSRRSSWTSRCARCGRRFPRLPMRPVVADFTRISALPVLARGAAGRPAARLLSRLDDRQLRARGRRRPARAHRQRGRAAAR